MTTGNNPETLSAAAIERLATTVIERLAERRVGFLWQGEPVRLKNVAGFAWVHYYYHTRKDIDLPRTYRLAGLPRPEAEARTLDMLVVPRGAAHLLAEMTAGFVVSPAAALVRGAIRARIPVLFESSALNDWYRDADAESVRNMCAAIDALRLRGVVFVGLDPGDAVATQRAEIPPVAAELGGCVLLDTGGWLSWADVAPCVAGAGEVRVAPGTRLTPEAADRLRRAGIRIREA